MAYRDVILSKTVEYVRAKKLTSTNRGAITMVDCPFCGFQKSAQIISALAHIKCVHCQKLFTLVDFIRLVENRQTDTEEVILNYVRDFLKIDIQTTQDAENLESIFKSYAARGWALVPCAKAAQIGHSGEKVMTGKEVIQAEWQKKENRNPSEWFYWKSSGLNLGVRTGQVSNLTIIDFDLLTKEEKAELVKPETTDDRKKVILAQKVIPEEIRNLMGTTLMQESHGGCYDKETEILTDEGWKLFKNLTKKEKIAQWNNSQIEYVAPSSYFDYKYTGEIYSINTKSMDLVVTPNHNMYSCESNWIRNNPSFKTMEELYHNYGPKTAHTIPSTFKWKGKEEKYFNLPINIKEYDQTRKPIGSISMDVWLEFLGWYLSEGSSYFTKSNKNYKITIWQSKPKNILAIYRLLKKLPFKICYFHTNRGNGNCNTGFNIFNKQLFLYLKRFGLSYDKYIPREILNLSSRQLNILYSSLMLGDGDKEGRYYTVSKQLANDVQELILKLGHKASITYRNPRTKNCKPSYVIRKLKEENTTFQTQDVKKISYNDKVYCVEVPSHLLIVRRNGKVLVCGNSHAFYTYCPELRKTSFNYDENGAKFHIDVENDGGQVIIAPSQAIGVEEEFTDEKGDVKKRIIGYAGRKFINDHPIIPIPEAFLTWLKARIKPQGGVLKSQTTEAPTTGEIVVPEGVMDEKGTIKDIQGNRNNTLMALGGIFRKEMNVKQTGFVLSVLNKHLLSNPLPNEEINHILEGLNNYIGVDANSISNEIIAYLKETDTATKMEIESAVFGQKTTSENKKRLDRTLVELIRDEKIVKKNAKEYRILKDMEWSDSICNVGTPLNFKVPYFDNYAHFNYGDIVLIGGTTKTGKSHVAINIIKRLVEQGIKPRYIFNENGARYSKIALQLGLKDGDFYRVRCSNPSDIIMKPNSVYIFDWYRPNDFTKTAQDFDLLAEKLDKSNSFMFCFAQLRDGTAKQGNENEWFAKDQIRQFVSCSAKYLYDDKEGVNTYFDVDDVRDSKTGAKRFKIPCKFIRETKEVKMIEEIEREKPVL